MPDRQVLQRLADQSPSRFELWSSFLNLIEARRVAEIGVFRGRLAAHLLDTCPQISTYYMIDPWRYLDDWEKPANRGDDDFRRIMRRALRRTSAHRDKRVVLRGTTTEVVDQIPDESLDFAYVDGDHTLRGITIDLTKVMPKLRDGGYLAGDDFSPSIWQHGGGFEPTLVFPYAVHFAEANDARIYGLPHGQFLIEKSRGSRYEFIDLTGDYDDLRIRTQVSPPLSLRTMLRRVKHPSTRKIVRVVSRRSKGRRRDKHQTSAGQRHG